MIISSFFFERHYLRILLPITLLLLCFAYFFEISKKKHFKMNIFFISSVVCLMVSDYLIYSNFVNHFTFICICITLYALLSILALKAYTTKIKFDLKKITTLPFLISVALLGYLIYSISDLILELLPNSIFFIIPTTLILLLYAAVSYYIYSSDAYSSGFKLIIAAFLCQFVVGFTVINELFLFNNFCTLFIVSAHILGIYVFMEFLSSQNPNILQDSIKKPL